LELLPFLEAFSIHVGLPELPKPPTGNPLDQSYLTRTHSPQLLPDDPTHLTIVKLNHESFMMTSEIISGNEKAPWGPKSLNTFKDILKEEMKGNGC